MTSPLRDQTARAAILTAAINALKDELEAEKRGALRDTLIAYNQETNGKTLPIIVPGVGEVGKVTLPQNQDAVKVTNPTAYAEYMEATRPNATHYVLVVEPAVQEKHLKTLAAGADWETGEVFDLALAAGRDGVAPKVPGVTAQRGEGFGTPSVTVTKAAQAQILDQFRSSTVLELTAGPDDAPADDSDIIDAEVVHTAESLKPLKRAALVDLCHSFGLDHVGTLPALRQRILDAQAADDTAADVA